MTLGILGDPPVERNSTNEAWDDIKRRLIELREQLRTYDAALMAKNETTNTLNQELEATNGSWVCINNHGRIQRTTSIDSDKKWYNGIKPFLFSEMV